MIANECWRTWVHFYLVLGLVSKLFGLGFVLVGQKSLGGFHPPGKLCCCIIIIIIIMQIGATAAPVLQCLFTLQPLCAFCGSVILECVVTFLFLGRQISCSLSWAQQPQKL